MASKKLGSIVSTQWLKGQLYKGIKNHRILDTSWGLKKSGLEPFRTEHIPGALFFDLNRCVNPLAQIPRNLPDPACFTEYVQTLGINGDTHVILYDRGNTLPAARTWWNFKAYGHDNTSLLEGGLAKWISEGLPVESGPMTLPEKMGNFKTNIRKEYIMNFEGMQEIVKSKSHQIIDARSPADYAGMNEEPPKVTVSAYEGLDLQPLNSPRVRGHISGSINLPEDDLLDPETKCLLPKKALMEVFRSSGVDMTKPMATLCYNGNAACVIALAAAACGHKDVSVYYGSWTEYGFRANADDVVLSSETSIEKGG